MNNPPWQAEWEIGPSLATRLVESQFPQLAPIRWSFLGEGWDNLALLANDSIVFRFPRRQLGAEIMESELAVLPRLVERFPDLVPRLTHVGEATSEYPVRFAGYPRLPGITACGHEWTDEQRIRLAAPLAEFLRQLHSIDESAAKTLGAPSDNLNRTGIPKRTDQGRQQLNKAVEAGLVSSQREDLLCDYLAEVVDDPPRLADGRQRARCLVHGDLYMRHLLVGERNGRLQAVIDWGDVHYGDPGIDLAVALCCLPKEALQEFVEVYGDIEIDARRVAMMRAIQHTALLTVYAHDIDDRNLLRAALASFEQLEKHLKDGAWR